MFFSNYLVYMWLEGLRWFKGIRAACACGAATEGHAGLHRTPARTERRLARIEQDFPLEEGAVSAAAQQAPEHQGKTGAEHSQAKDKAQMPRDRRMSGMRSGVQHARRGG
jgi:hypothetical protein